MEMLFLMVAILCILYFLGGHYESKCESEDWFMHLTGNCDCVDTKCKTTCDKSCDIEDEDEDENEDEDSCEDESCERVSSWEVSVTWTSKSKERKWNGMTWKKGEVKILNRIPPDTENGKLQKNGLIISW